MNKEKYTEGIRGDSAVILRDGVTVPIKEIVSLLNNMRQNKVWCLVDDWNGQIDTEDVHEDDDNLYRSDGWTWREFWLVNAEDFR